MPVKLIYFVSEDWVFCSHRLPLAVAARQAGFDVLVVTRVLRHGELITNAGLRLIHFNLIRRGMNPLKEFMAIFRLWRLYRKEKPDVVHHVALKPVLYGSIAARMAGVPIVVNAYTGLGFLFISPKRYVKWARFLVIKLLRLMNAGGEVRSIFQNPDDMALMADAVQGSVTELIRGSGVDTELFPASPENQGVPLVVLPARMLWDKGVAEFVQAAGQLRGAGVVARFVLVGDRDDGNPSAISSSQLALWNAQGNVEWWGQRTDMATILAQANIVCLPSYREGVPKALLEAAACARAIVTTDVPGCREIVKHGVNGFLVPAKDAQALADAISELIENADLRKRMGLKGRELVESEFSLKHVIPRTLRLYAPSL